MLALPSASRTSMLPSGREPAHQPKATRGIHPRASALRAPTVLGEAIDHSNSSPRRAAGIPGAIGRGRLACTSPFARQHQNAVRCFSWATS